MILVTGGTGFLGKHIVSELAQSSHPLRLLVRKPTQAHIQFSSFSKSLEFIEGDLLDTVSLEKALEGVQKVVHVAGVVSFARRDRRQMRLVNEQGTANLVNTCLEKDIEKFVHVSSTSALGRTQENQAINEKSFWQDSPLNTYYGVTKYLAEKQVFRGVEEGLKAVICNPTIIVGSGEWNEGTPHFFRWIDEKNRHWAPAGSNGFVAAQDVARAVSLLLDSRFENGERFVLAGENISYVRLLETIARNLGKKAPSRILPSFWAKKAGFYLEKLASLAGKTPKLTAENMLTSSHSYHYDSTRFQETFSFRFTPIQQVIEETAQIYLSEKRESSKK